MNKTSIYLTDTDLENLRALSRSTGCSQAELIREAVRALFVAQPPRQFRSMGVGASGGEGARRWSSDELAARRGVGRPPER